MSEFMIVYSHKKQKKRQGEQNPDKLFPEEKAAVFEIGISDEGRSAVDHQ